MNLLCIEISKKKYEVKVTVAIDYLEYLSALISSEENNRLLLINVNGCSREAEVGVPKLILKEQKAGSREDLLEFDFVVKPAELVKRKKLNWELNAVYDVSQFPLVPNWIKVNSAQNADIAMVQMKLPDK